MTLAMRTAPDRDLSDFALAERAGAGDESAFETLDRRHRSTLLHHCRGILRNSHDAEEAVQGVLLKAYRALSAGQRPASLLPWLMVIARNECFDIIRARRSTEELPLNVASSATRPDDLVVHREELRALRADMKELPTAQRAALVLRSMGDLPHAEIARLLGGTAADARTLCHEARLSLAECHEGRSLECSAVLERIEAGDGRALRARRIRAHLRACEGCQSAADSSRAPRRSGLGALFPFPWFAALRSLLFGGGGASGAVGGVGSLAVVGIPLVAIITAVGVGVSVHAEGPERALPASASVATPTSRLGSPPAAATTSTPATSPVPTSVPRTAGRSRPGKPSSPEIGSTADRSVPGPAASTGLATPRVQVPGTGITVPSVEAPTISAQTPAIRVPILGVTVPSAQLPPVSGVRVDPAPVAQQVRSAVDGLAPLMQPLPKSFPAILPSRPPGG